MNGTIIRKAAWDSKWLLLTCCSVIILFEVLITHALATLAPELIRLWSSIEFLKGLFKFTFHIDLSGNISAVTLLAIGAAHPFMFAVSWGYIITVGTRVPVGEIDRGTADLLFALPTSRSSIFLSNSAVLMVQIVLLAGSVVLGLWIGSMTVDLGAPFPLWRFTLAAVNFGMLLFAICGATYLASCSLSRRSIAIGLVVSLLLASFLINVMEAFLPFVRNIGFLGLLSYHRPAELIRTGAFPATDIFVLFCIGVGCWGVGLWRFAQRDVPTA